VSSDKTERLINLTLGLLSSKRYLTKNEIFRNIAGYSGSPETMERMFERDKDELRGLGIEIEVGQIDPLFEDEQGYLIRSSDIQIQPEEFSKEELFLMAMAGNLWKESALSGISDNALIKVASLDGGVGFNNVALPLIEDEKFNIGLFEKIIEAIQIDKYLTFVYKSKERIVAPYGLKNTKGFWYLIAQEKDEEIKVFKLIRIESKIAILDREKNFTKPENFAMNLYLESALREDQREAILRIRESKVNNLRSRGAVTDSTDGWDTLKIVFDDLNDFTKEILWYGDDIYVVSPNDLRDEIIKNLKQVVNG
jgi:proteasome accessory factor B